MEAPRNSLNVYLSWPQTAALLGLTLADEALPVRLDCPLCGHRRMHVYPDGLWGGAWFACSDCGRCGDLIELAAALWGMDLHATLLHLAHLGASLPSEALEPERVADYVRDYPGSRQRLNALWERARAWLPQARSPALNRLRAQLHLSDTLSLERWQQGPGRLLGGLPREEVEACFCPLSTGQGGVHPERYRLNPSRGRVFRGPGWSDVLVIPYHDLPGHICTLHFIGREGKAADRVFRPQRVLARSGSNQHQSQPPYQAEAGLAGLQTLEAALPSWDGVAFAVGDITLALRLQLQNFVSSTRPLPLLCWHDDAKALTRSIWRVLAGRTVVFWAWRLSPEVLHQAVQADGLLALAGPEDLSASRVEHYLRRAEPLPHLRRLRRAALPWREVVRRWAEQQPDGALTELLLGLQRYRLDLHSLVRECGGGRLQELLSSPLPPRGVQVGSRTIVERPDGWYQLCKGGREVQLLNAVLRLDTVVPAEEGLHYTGRILFRGEEVPFQVQAQVLERHPGRWLREFLLRQGKGVLHLAPGVSGLIEIALKFHEPALG